MNNTNHLSLMTAAELVKLLGNAKKLSDDFELAISLEAQAGLRKSEIFCLEVSMIDLYRRIIVVPSKLSRAFGAKVISIQAGLFHRLEKRLTSGDFWPPDRLCRIGWDHAGRIAQLTETLSFELAPTTLRLSYAMHRYSQLLNPAELAAEMRQENFEAKADRLAILPADEVENWFAA